MVKEKTINLEPNSEGVYETGRNQNKRREDSKVHNRSHAIRYSDLYIPLGGIYNSFIRAGVSINKKALTPLAFGLAAIGFIAGLSRTIKRGKHSRLR